MPTGAYAMNLDIITDSVTGQQWARDLDIPGSTYAPYVAPTPVPVVVPIVSTSSIPTLSSLSEAELDAFVVSTREQIRVLQAQLKEAYDIRNDASEPSGNTNTSNSNTMEPEEIAQEKEKAVERGVGMAKAHVYVEEDDGDKIIISLTDYFEGDAVSIEVDGEAVAFDQECSDVRDLSVKVCGVNIEKPYTGEEDVEVAITINAIEKSLTISETNQDGWLSW